MKQERDTREPVVSLRDVAFEMDVLNEEWTAYVNRRTGELITVTDEEARAVEAGGESAEEPEWQRELLPKLREVLESDEFLALPDKHEIHEYGIMERFCTGVEKVALRDELLRAIQGRGAFGRFKDLIRAHGLADAWQRYRERALEDIAADWLDANGIAYAREARKPSDDGA
jgi:hypothetical protein